MDGREGMTLSGDSRPYYIHRGSVSGSGSLSHSPLHPPPPFRTLPNPSPNPSPNPILAPLSNARAPSTASFSIEQPTANFNHIVSIPPGTAATDPVRKKRGRPRKYAPDGQVSLGLSSLPAKPKLSSQQDSSEPKRARGRPPGTGRKQRLASLGEWMNSSAGQAFAPYVVKIAVGEDIVSKILQFAQQRPRAVCILSGTGSVSSVTLRQSETTEPTVTYEGQFEILCLSGSYLVAEEGGSKARTGGISASLSSADGHVIGGSITVLIAATPVQVVLCSFVFGNVKGKEKVNGDSTSEAAQPSDEKQGSSPTAQIYSQSPMNSWPGQRPVEVRMPHSDIDLTKG